LPGDRIDCSVGIGSSATAIDLLYWVERDYPHLVRIDGSGELGFARSDFKVE